MTTPWTTPTITTLAPAQDAMSGITDWDFENSFTNPSGQAS